MLYKCLSFLLAVILSAGTLRTVSADDSNLAEIKRELTEVRGAISKAAERLDRLEKKLGDGKAIAPSENVTDDDAAWRELGLQVVDAEDEVMETRKSQSRGSSVLVVAVRSESAAAKAGIQKHDRLIGLHGLAVKNMADLRQALAKGRATTEKRKFLIIRDGQTMYGYLAGI